MKSKGAKWIERKYFWVEDAKSEKTYLSSKLDELILKNNSIELGIRGRHRRVEKDVAGGN